MAKRDRDGDGDKAVLDALTDLGMWKDDGQVFAGEILKFYHAKNAAPGCHVVIKRLVQGADQTALFENAH